VPRANVRGERTRQRLLAAGLELFADLTPAEFLAGLTAQAVSGRAGVTTGSFYTHFPHHASYVDALIEYGLSRQPADDRIATETFGKIVEYANAPDTHLISDLNDLADFNIGIGIEEIGVTEFLLAMWTRRRDPRVLELLRRRYELFQGDYAAGYEIIRQRWNAEWQPPFTHEIGTAVVTCIAEGLMVRHCIEPETISKEIFGHVLLAFVENALGAATPAGDGDPWQSFIVRHGIRDLEPTYDAEISRPSGAMVDAAITLLADADLDACTVEDIAAQAGVSTTHVYGAWGSRPRLATAVVARLSEPTDVQRGFDLDLKMPGLRALDRQLGRLASLFLDLARSRPVLLSLALQGSIEHLGRPPEDEGNLGRSLVPPIEVGQTDSSIAPDVDARALARSLAFALASEALTRRENEDAADDLLAFVRTVHLAGVAKKRLR